LPHVEQIRIEGMANNCATMHPGEFVFLHIVVLLQSNFIPSVRV
jgi:hypothetical protein